MRTPDVAKRVTWGQRLQRFRKWTGTVAQFCVMERVTVASFYQWRRKLQRNGARSDASGQRGRQRTVRNSSPADAGFVPVQVVGSAVVEVFLVEGARLSIPVDATHVLSAVVRALSAGSATVSPDSGGRSC